VRRLIWVVVVVVVGAGENELFVRCLHHPKWVSELESNQVEFC
jgi:hypothetical protein